MAGTVGHKVLAGQKKIELDKKSVVSLAIASLGDKNPTRR